MIDRRSFLASLAACAALPQFSFGQDQPACDSPWKIDSQSAPVFYPSIFELSAFPPAPEQAALMRQSGMTAVSYTVSQPEYEKTIAAIAWVEGAAELQPQNWMVVRQLADLDIARRDKRLGIIMNFQYPQPFDSDLSRIEIFRRMGVRIMQLTYNLRSLLGDGCLEPENSGISHAGHEAIQRMNAAGVAVDLSHSGQRTTAGGIAASAKPVLISHSGCNAVHKHPRNKDDADLKALADKGGYLGIYCMPYLGGAPNPATRAMMLDHLEHAIKVCGEDHVGIGSDNPIQPFPDTPEARRAMAADIARRKKLGVGAPEEDTGPYVPELNSVHKFDLIAAGLAQRGYPCRVIEKIMGTNFKNALAEIW